MAISLRDPIEADLPVLFEHQHDAEAARMAVMPPREWDAFVAHWKEHVLGDPSARKKVIVEDDQVLGNVVSFLSDGRRLVGYFIGRAHWGRGVATAALGQFLLHHESERPLHAYVAVTNPASLRVLERCGFLPQGDPAPGEDGVVELLLRLD